LSFLAVADWVLWQDIFSKREKYNFLSSFMIVASLAKKLYLLGLKIY
jgi:hypothetical protein